MPSSMPSAKPKETAATATARVKRGKVHEPANACQPHALMPNDSEPGSSADHQVRRLRWGTLPEPPKGDVPWAKRRPELFSVQEAEHALLVRASKPGKT
jgi:hypothetical protein